MIAFENEGVAALVPERTVAYDGPIPLPSIGERVENPAAGMAGQPMSGTLVSRAFGYYPDRVGVILTLRNPIGIWNQHSIAARRESSAPQSKDGMTSPEGESEVIPVSRDHQLARLISSSTDFSSSSIQRSKAEPPSGTSWLCVSAIKG